MLFFGVLVGYFLAQLLNFLKKEGFFALIAEKIARQRALEYERGSYTGEF